MTELEEAIVTIDKSGISRSLALFRKCHLVHAIEDGDGNVKYELCMSHSHSDDDDDDTGDLHGTHRGGFPQVSEGKGGSAGRWPVAPRKVACAAHRWRSPPAYPGGD